MRKPRDKSIRNDGEDSVQTRVESDGVDGVLLSQWDFGGGVAPSDSIHFASAKEARLLADWLSRWADWEEWLNESG